MTAAFPVTAVGVDTWSPGWYVDGDGPAGRWLEEFATVRGEQGARIVPQAIDGHRVGWFPGQGLVFAEGHPSDLGLCAPAGLLERYRELEGNLLAAGVPISPARHRRRYSSAESLHAWQEGPAGLRRVDGTVNVEPPTRGEGLALLAGIAAAVQEGRGVPNVRWGADRGVETVYWLGYGGRKVLGRWYDKGREAAVKGRWAEAAPRGLVIRGEDQRRFQRGNRRDVWEIDGRYLRASFHRRFYPLWQATKGLTVAGPVAIASKLYSAVEAGEVSAREAERLLAHCLFRVVAGRRGVTSKSTMYDRERRLRDLGLQLSDGVLEEVEVNLGDQLEAVLDADAWERAS